MGPPGVGKGTQAKRIKNNLGITHVSTGELLRSEISKITDIGIIAKKFIDQGKLVPDDILLHIMRDRLKKNDCDQGFTLDGFPRTLDQATGLEEIMDEFHQKLDMAISLFADEDELVNRLVKRGLKSGRSDDTDDVIRKRQKIYWAQTAPLLDFYQERDLLKSVNGIGEIIEITDRILNIIK